jgi:hypothetical protein
MPWRADEGVRLATYSLALGCFGAVTYGWASASLSTGGWALILGLVGSLVGLLLGVASWPGGPVQSLRFRVIAVFGATLNLLILILGLILLLTVAHDA